MKMKKFLLTLAVSAISFGNVVFAFDYDINEMNENEKVAWFWSEKDPEKVKMKKEKKEQKKIAKNKKKEVKAKEKKTKKAEKKQVKKTAKKEKKLAKVEKNEKCPLKYRDDEAVDKYVAMWEEDLCAYQRDSKMQRDNMIANWKKARKMEVAKEYTDGKYADLYKLPTWPFAALFAEHDSLLNVKTVFNYQTSAFDSNGKKMDLSRHVFGEDDVRLRDILLAYKLGCNLIVGDNALGDLLGYTTMTGNGDEYTWTSSHDKINFVAESDELRTSINYSRYIFDNQVLIGFEIPVAQKKHYLKTSFYKYELGKNINTSARNLWTREETFKTAFEKILNLKDLNYSPKHSVVGVGDIKLFASCKIRSKFFENANFAWELQLPTSKHADKTKLWAPEVGEEFVKLASYTEFLWGIRDWFNPHLLVKGVYSASANVDRRVPKKIKHTDRGLNDAFTANDMLLGEYLSENNNSTFADWDTTAKGMADESKTVSIQPGVEVAVRIGNIFEKALFRRGFLDVYYDFRAKFEDSVSGLPEYDYNLELLEKGTNQIENNIGLNFSYQFDYHTRLQMGGRYCFHGRNVQQNMQLSCNLGIEF